MVPPLICIAAGMALSVWPHLREEILVAANRVWSQPAYLHTVYTGSMPALSLPKGLRLGAESASLRGVISMTLALTFALTSVFRARLPRMLRVGAFLEGPLVVLRSLQSGHVGDYVVWMTIGVATIGGACMVLLR